MRVSVKEQDQLFLSFLSQATKKEKIFEVLEWLAVMDCHVSVD